MPEKKQKLLGRIDRAIPKGAGGYGFILTSDYKKFFYHTDDVPNRVLPEVGTMVYFDILPETTSGKSPRAVHIEIASIPASIQS